MKDGITKYYYFLINYGFIIKFEQDHDVCAPNLQVNMETKTYLKLRMLLTADVMTEHNFAIF